MKPNLTGLLVVLATALCVTSAGVAAPTPTPAPEPGDFTPAVMPLGMSNQPTTVVVQLAADPVTVVDADAAAPLTDGQKQQLRTQLRSQQAPVAQQVQSLGGQVLATYQSSYNGLKVRIRADQARSLSTLPGVVAVHPLQLMEPSNVHAIPLIGAPQVWGGLPGLHGEGIKIGVIDTGIDYTHSDFGGPGTVAAYQAALGQDTADPTLTSYCMTPALTPCFGPAAPKVKGGVDLVGDDYNADPSSPSWNPTPVPDPNPLDCAGHGSHVAGTAAGFGVTSAGQTYAGPYNADTVSSGSWNVGPGVAPKADLYAIKIFGCSGSTDATIDGIEWAVTHGMDVINLSLGSPFGSANDPAAEAASNAAKAGVIVVASTGNEASSPYITTSPGTGTGAISVAANDPTQANAGANLALSTGATLQAINANGATFSDGATLPVKVLLSSPTVISSGCNPASYVGVAGNVVVTRRVVGGCARVARAIIGQQAGAAAVVMVNNTNEFPPVEGQITRNPDTGVPFTVTIPFLGVPASATPSLIAANGGSTSLTNTTLANPGFLNLASFSSFGPRSGDSWLKPDLTGPGVALASVGMGTGNLSATMSGSSMAAPNVAGVAALVKQAHPSWRRVRYWKAAVVNTADPSQVGGYVTAGAGTGLVQALPAVQTQVVATGDRDGPALNFGFAELDRDYAGRNTVTLRNLGDQPATFAVSTQLDAGSPHSLVLRANEVTVRPNDSTDVRVELDVPAATAGAASDPTGSFHDVSGLVAFTPAAGSNNGVTLRVPYYLVPQAVSHVSARVDSSVLLKGSAVATITNRRGAVPGNADWYSWGLADRRDHGLASDDLRAAGVQSWNPQGVPLLVFAISTTKRWSNAAQNEFDVLVDLNNDGNPDYDVVAADRGSLTTGTPTGVDAVAVFNIASGAGSIHYLADAPTDSNTITLPVDFSQLCGAGSPCLSPSSPRFTYTVESFGLTDQTSDTISATAQFNAFAPSISTGMFDTVAPNASATETVTIDPVEWALTPSVGLMIVTHDNPSGQDEAQLIQVGRGPQH
ncbi:MAG: S8 family serine peptidase [Gaiellaceae bacterium]